MKIIKKISENNMILEFLKAELKSERFDKHVINALKRVSSNEKLILDANLNNSEENILRKNVLRIYRGFDDKLLFDNFPRKIEWYEATLNEKDFEKIRYINYDYWKELSGGTRNVKDSSKTINANIEIYNQSNNTYKEIAKEIKNGKKLPKVILVSKSKKDNPIVLEGHSRLTATGLLEPELRKKIEAIIGFSADLDRWVFY